MADRSVDGAAVPAEKRVDKVHTTEPSALSSEAPKEPLQDGVKLNSEISGPIPPELTVVSSSQSGADLGSTQSSSLTSESSTAQHIAAPQPTETAKEADTIPSNANGQEDDQAVPSSASSKIAVPVDSISQSIPPSPAINTPVKPREPAYASGQSFTPYQDLSSEEQATIQAENNQAVEEAEAGIIADSSDSASTYTDDFSDAGYGSDSRASASTSLCSSVRDYVFENGRRYHKFREGAYAFPNDDSEQDREDMKHAMMVNLCQQLHFAPIGDNPQNILDMGTGTGIWAIEMGDQFPSANILGVDLSGIQPTWVPPNVRFMIDDVESPWLHPPNHFDYVHARHTIQAFRNWSRVMERAYNHIKPGGWLELQEVYHFPQCHDGTMPKDHAVARYWDLVKDGLAELGVDFAGTLSLADKMRAAGYVNVTERIFHIPIGVWPRNKVLKTVGLYWRTVLMDGLHPIALGPLTRGLKWSREEVELFLVEVRKAYMETWVHSHMPLHIIYGQRPEYDTAVRESD